MSDEKHIQREGFEAGCRGDDPRVCPFLKMTAEWREWQRWHAYGVEWHKTIDAEASDPPEEKA
jgi:hypothetical protein